MTLGETSVNAAVGCLTNFAQTPQIWCPGQAIAQGPPPGGGVIWGHGQPPTPPPTSEKLKKNEMYQRGRKFEALFRHTNFFWPLTPPLRPRRPPRGSLRKQQLGPCVYLGGGRAFAWGGGVPQKRNKLLKHTHTITMTSSCTRNSPFRKQKGQFVACLRRWASRKLHSEEPGGGGGGLLGSGGQLPPAPQLTVGRRPQGGGGGGGLGGGFWEGQWGGVWGGFCPWGGGESGMVGFGGGGQMGRHGGYMPPRPSVGPSQAPYLPLPSL